MPSSPIEAFDQARYLSRKKWERRQAWIFSILGGIVLLDSAVPIPIPLVGGPSIILGGVLLCYGYYQFQLYKKLPVHDAVKFVRSLERHFTRMDLFLALQLPPETTDTLIQELIQNGFVEPVNTELAPESDIEYRVIS
ncbi:MAG: hypothetical protein HQM13_17630 [SAR324 cluster bacterium]|nr:hypothetical protein [SAR324 cluster bacterium]